jgi:hypothetical protein
MTSSSASLGLELAAASAERSGAKLLLSALRGNLDLDVPPNRYTLAQEQGEAAE